MKLNQRIEAIQLLLSDVDGVMTDGRLSFDNQGIESKTFHVRDGLAIKFWQRAGFRFGVITARSSHVVSMRMAELGVSLVRQGSEDKLTAARQIAGELGLTLEQVGYIGDDLADLRLLKQVGLAVSVADGAPEVQQVAHFVTKANGGHAALRELIEMMLKTRNRWGELLQNYVDG